MLILDDTRGEVSAGGGLEQHFHKSSRGVSGASGGEGLEGGY